MPLDRKFQFFFIKCIVGYSEVEVASCHRIGSFNVFYKVYCRIY